MRTPFLYQCHSYLGHQHCLLGVSGKLIRKGFHVRWRNRVFGEESIDIGTSARFLDLHEKKKKKRKKIGIKCWSDSTARFWTETFGTATVSPWSVSSTPRPRSHWSQRSNKVGWWKFGFNRNVSDLFSNSFSDRLLDFVSSPPSTFFFLFPMKWFSEWWQATVKDVDEAVSLARQALEGVYGNMTGAERR